MRLRLRLTPGAAGDNQKREPPTASRMEKSDGTPQ
jgi:hypothetical protein